MPSSWEWCKVNDIGEIITGNTPSKDNAEFYKGNIPFFKPTDLEQGKNVINSSDHLSDSGFEQSRQLPINSILVTCIGATIGKTGLISVIGSCNQQINAIIPNKIIFPLYGYYVCNSNYMQTEIKEHASATTLPILNKGNFSNLLFPLPPLSEQFRIVAEIEKWFSLIDTIESEKANLQTIIKQSKSKILDLAIHGKLVPQDPNDEPASKLLKRINPNAEITCDNGQYGKCPEGWCLTRLGDISNYGENKNIQVEKIGSKEWILELEDIEKDSANITQILTKHERSINGTRHKFKKGDILYSKLRTYLNKVLIAPKDGYCTSEIMVFNTLEGLSNEYICHVLRSPYFLDYTLLCGYGVKMPRLSTIDACNGLIPIPPLAEQKRIVNAIDKAFNKLDSIMESL